MTSSAELLLIGLLVVFWRIVEVSFCVRSLTATSGSAEAALGLKNSHTRLQKIYVWY